MANHLTIYAFVLLVILSFGCNRSGNHSSVSQTASQSTVAASGQPLIIGATESPTDGDSREPDLNATADGRIVLSWVEKLGEKRYALRMAARDQTGWNETRTVAEGDNWFVNWADFPSVIALNDGSLAAHWLVKSGTATYAYNVNTVTITSATLWLVAQCGHRQQ